MIFFFNIFVGHVVIKKSICQRHICQSHKVYQIVHIDNATAIGICTSLESLGICLTGLMTILYTV